MRPGALLLATIAIASLALAAGRACAQADAPWPRAPHVLTVPTAWVLERDHAWGSAGLDHRGAGMIDVVASLGGIAEVDVGLDDAIVGCTCDGGARILRPQRLGMAGVKLGFARGGLAGAIGYRRSFAGLGAVDVAALYVAGSAELASLRAHAGVTVWDAREADRRLGPARVRPFVALEWSPPHYPRTTLVGDLSWLPELTTAGPELRWIGGWGVRYQALAWGSIELDVRHREGDDLGGSTVMVRVNGVIGRSPSPKREDHGLR